MTLLNALWPGCEVVLTHTQVSAYRHRSEPPAGALPRKLHFNYVADHMIVNHSFLLTHCVQKPGDTYVVNFSGNFAGILMNGVDCCIAKQF